ncbi:MAG: rhodanese-like domain-containing protein [Defluviitaleaceae bacterium]|nr:rhodanese-like domain-containing protein [Defluviitaleaceae bacterium]
MKTKINLLRVSSLSVILGVAVLLIGCDVLEMIDEQTDYQYESTGVCAFAPTPELDAESPAAVIREPIIITAQQAEEIMLQDGVLILDVRTPEEFQSGHIENAILLPYSDLFALAESVILDKDMTILVYCQSGRRSNIAAWLLYELGFTAVYDFGGILDWHGPVITGA